jgi:hypothetical protein
MDDGDFYKKMKNKIFSQETKPKELVLVNAADIVPRPLDWIWDGHLLRGALELTTGLPNLGKSTAQISQIASITTDKPFPDGCPSGQPANVIVLTAEDMLDQIVIPRLQAAGANLLRVKIIKCIRSDDKDRQFLLGEDLDMLEKAVAEVGDVALITADPITAYMGGKIDGHRTTEVRSQLGPLKDVAEMVNVGISSITHLPKSASQKAMDWYIGSQGFIAAARVGHVASRRWMRTSTATKLKPVACCLLTSNTMPVSECRRWHFVGRHSNSRTRPIRSA